uniref:Peptidyl-prolyl cis-trans isomerase n=1 Tax=Chaetoceros debilis TaxID=122233 RepID=A0A7S3PV01_9STRA|mmetsp:Transcript_28366/g.43452  ORF Transcript_28366/g.43452 Transcript_28366/m.43452 type:complete len:118 (+) Transcript_28366:93-446(+)|eukprot:CAMPEP_0197738688 /NCGR_PEP_ID=MMETSP1435-20131217/15897_1 /TAXON_ID=426625 /ORGANISM="Chaetoceros brevis, Strain CCMP164" /LENGTH=117 /DNA_ID=CAMNT_0043327681 /DNA_START=16 /DNA_END=369 /DNA_ORIENTATION=+
MTDQVRAAHLLIKHTGSRNPVSRRTGERVHLDPADARVELESLHRAIVSHPNSLHSFPSFAKERSDCSSFRQDGDLGMFGRGMMQESFERAAFSLNVGEMSGIVESDSGFHLIYRIA